MPQACELRLPLPPSVNAAYRNVAGRGRVATAALVHWKHEAGWIAQGQRRENIAGPFRVRLRVPTKARADLDNYIKPCLDLLVSHRITPDDRFAQSVLAERDDEVEDGMCILTVEAA